MENVILIRLFKITCLSVELCKFIDDAGKSKKIIIILHIITYHESCIGTYFIINYLNFKLTSCRKNWYFSHVTSLFVFVMCQRHLVYHFSFYGSKFSKIEITRHFYLRVRRFRYKHKESQNIMQIGLQSWYNIYQWNTSNFTMIRDTKCY